MKKVLRHFLALAALLMLFLLPVRGEDDFSVEEETAAPAPTAAAPTPAPTPAPAYDFPLEGTWPDLKIDSRGSSVYWLKLRLYELGYARYAPSEDFTYTNATARQIRELQRINGLEETGEADTALQAFIFSDACLPADTTPKPTATPRPTDVPLGPTAEVALPPLDEEGFLPWGAGDEFVYESPEEGLWIYLSDSLSVRIESWQQDNPSLQWFETRVRTRGETEPENIFSKDRFDSQSFQNPAVIARGAGVVLAISDDCYTYRTTKARRSGVIIRDGQVVTDNPFTKYDTSYFPPLDVMAFLPNGDMAVYETGTVTAEELMALGVKNSYSFGPILIQNGREHVRARWADNPMEYKKHPRNAVGQIGERDYLFITVTGRTHASEGVTCGWLVDRLLEKGAKTAFNLDGGNSACVVFMGKVVNRRLESSVRTVTSLITFGHSDLVPKKLQ